MVINTFPPALLSEVTFKSLDIKVQRPCPTELSTRDELVPDINIAKMDRALLTPSVVGHLLKRYNQCILPRYDLPVPELLEEDIGKLRKLQTGKLFQVLVACAIASARESYYTSHTEWAVIARLCRDWADELFVSCITERDGEALKAVLLLMVHELADCSRGMIWELHAIAIRTCLQLGWHRQPASLALSRAAMAYENTPDAIIAGSNGTTELDSAASLEQAMLLKVLKAIEGYVAVFPRAI